MNRSPLRAFLLIALALGWLALSPTARAVCQEGCGSNENTFLGEDALFTGGHIGANTAIGYHALYSDDFGASNTAVGSNALYSTNGAYFNTGVGAEALSTDTDAGYNTAVGYQALNGITGFAHSDNVAVGYRAMANADSFACVAIGSEALTVNTGQLNTAVGIRAMENTTTGANNTACGWAAMNHNLTGTSNTAVGLNGLAGNTTGNDNTVMGSFGTVNNTTGSHNAAFGAQCLYNNTTGNNNIAVGFNAGSNLTTGDNNIDIGNQGVAGEVGTIRIGTIRRQTKTFVAGVNGGAVTGPAVKVNAAGQLGTAPSSARFKEEIKPMDTASETILALKPMSFRYRKEIDPERARQFGLVAEEVAEVNPDLVDRDAEGKVYSVRYEAVNAMLLNEFIKEHRRVEELEAGMKVLTASLKEQAAQIQKVSAQLEASIRGQQTVVSNP